MAAVTIRVDLHVHSEESYDGHEPVELILAHAAAIELDAVVITDHDTMSASKRAASLAAEYGLIGIAGVEVSTADGHLLAVGVDRMPPRRESYAETVAWIHDHGGVAIVPHPFQRSRHGVRRSAIPVGDEHAAADAEPGVVVVGDETTSDGADAGDAGDAAGAVEEIDAVEVFNAWLFTGYRNRRARRFAVTHGYPGVAASDAHHLNYVGRAFTEVTVEGRDRVGDVTAEDVLAAIRAGTTRVDGKRAPVPMAAKHYVVAAVRRCEHYTRTGSARAIRAAADAAREAASITRVGGLQAAKRLRRAASWVR